VAWLRSVFVSVALTTLFFLAVCHLSTAWSQVPTHVWSRGFTATGDDVLFTGRVAVDSSDNIVIAGFFSGTIDLGGGALVSAGGEDFFLAKFSRDGAHLWSKRFGNADHHELVFLVVDGSDKVVISGGVSGPVDFGGGLLTSAGSDDIYLAKFDGSGNHLWSKLFGDSSWQAAESIAKDNSGNIVIAGRFEGTVNFGGDALTCVGGFDDIFVAKFSPSGDHLWSRRFGDAVSYTQWPMGAATDDLGDVIVVGEFDGTLDFGGGPLISGDSDEIFVVKFDQSGSHIWSWSHGGPGHAGVDAVTTDASRNIILTGGLWGSAGFGAGSLRYGLYVAKFDPNGGHLWSRYPGSASLYHKDVAVDTWGYVDITGTFEGELDFGGGPLTSLGSQDDVYVAKLDLNGNHVWSQRFGDDGMPQRAVGVAADGSGNVIIVGYYAGAVDFGGGLLMSGGEFDGFVAKFGPGPSPTFLRSFVAGYEESGITICWQLAEAGLGMKYHVMRSEAPDADFWELNHVDIVQDNLSFAFIDKTCKPGLLYRYRVDVVDEDGRRMLFETEAISTPELSLALSQNHPNPFNPTTTITFSSPEANRVTLNVYDAGGKLVRTLVNEEMPAGTKDVAWNGTDNVGNRVSSGVYFYRLTAGKQTLTKKMVLIK
jgi:uncharacterized protein (AIM24 family)